MRPITLVRLRIAIYTILTLASAWQSSMSDVHWLNLSWEQQSCVIAGMFILWCTNMAAFFDKSVWKWDASINGNITKTNETQTTKSTP